MQNQNDQAPMTKCKSNGRLLRIFLCALCVLCGKLFELLQQALTIRY